LGRGGGRRHHQRSARGSVHVGAHRRTWPDQHAARSTLSAAREGERRMAGGYYTALSGMRTRMDALDRIATDIANASTAGYKTERATTVQADRPSFGATLQSAVDVANGESRMDLRPGALATTGRSLD